MGAGPGHANGTLQLGLAWADDSLDAPGPCRASLVQAELASLALPASFWEAEVNAAWIRDRIPLDGRGRPLLGNPAHTGERGGGYLPADASQVRQIRITQLDAQGRGGRLVEGGIDGHPTIPEANLYPEMQAEQFPQPHPAGDAPGRHP